MEKSSRAQASSKREALTKTCVRCGETRDADQFKKHKLTRDGLDSWCKPCSSEYSRWHGMAKRYGLSKEHYLQLLKDQDGKCAICGCGLGRAKQKSPDVDHCHKTKRVRGILCRQCNMAIGLMKDSDIRLTAAADYIRRGGAVSEDIVRSSLKRLAVPDGTSLELRSDENT